MGFASAIDSGEAKRIDAACFRDGNEDEYHVEFWLMSGSVFRSCYNARTTQTDYGWIPCVGPDAWVFERLKAMAEPIYYNS